MTPSPLLRALERDGLLVLDGALATELERHGADLSGGLWSARLLLEGPDLITRVHRDYLEAGADVVTTAGYQASVPGFVRAGLSREEAEALLVGSVELARSARDAFWADALAADPGLPGRRVRPVVATSVGPYGAVLADGSEYTGAYDLDQADLVRFHRERLAVLAGAGVEVLACETIPSQREAEALVEALGEHPGMTAWVTFSARNERETGDGSRGAACAAFLDRQPQVVAVGVNCVPVQHVTGLLQRLAGGTDKPLVVYPNSGETWDAVRQVWTGSAAGPDFGRLTREWYAAGARLVGGCCRTGPDDIRAVAAALRPPAP